jgi:predicted Zn-dependent peptidase
MSVPGDELDRGLELQGDVLRAPTFPKKELDRWLRDQSLFYTTTGPTSQAAVARSALAYAWFPADHPYGQRPDPAELEDVKRGALRKEFAAWTSSAPIVALVVGDVAWDDVEPGITALVEGLGAPGEAAKELPFDPPAGARMVAVDMPGQKQVAVRLRLPAPFEDDPDRPAFETAGYVLGGTFLSRLNRSLREEKGFTYGADASYQSGATWGMFTIAVDVGSENLLDTLRTIDAELATMAGSGPDEDELVMARRSLASMWNDTFLTAGSVADLYLDVLDEGTTVAAHRARIEAIEEMTTADVQRVAARWLGADAPRTWVLVGDRATMADPVAAYGLPTTWTDPASAILGTFGPPEGTHE